MWAATASWLFQAHVCIAEIEAAIGHDYVSFEVGHEKEAERRASNSLSSNRLMCARIVARGLNEKFVGSQRILLRTGERTISRTVTQRPFLPFAVIPKEPLDALQEFQSLPQFFAAGHGPSLRARRSSRRLVLSAPLNNLRRHDPVCGTLHIAHYEMVRFQIARLPQRALSVLEGTGCLLRLRLVIVIPHGPIHDALDLDPLRS